MRIGIIGLGNIGSGLATRFADHHDVILYDRHPDRAQQLAAGRFAADLDELSGTTDVIIVAVKPKDMSAVAKQLKARKNQVVLSVAAGINGTEVAKLFPKAQTARLMPNIALVCGQAVMALEDDPNLESAVRTQLEGLLSLAGKVLWLPEGLMEAVGAVSGSGLAFVMVMIEAMADAGIALGLSAHTAREVAALTVQGAASLVEAQERGLSDLRWQVTSPGGTTIAGLHALEKGGARAAMIDAVLTAHRRAQTVADDV